MKRWIASPLHCCDRPHHRNKVRKYLFWFKFQIARSIMGGKEQHLTVDGRRGLLQQVISGLKSVRRMLCSTSFPITFYLVRLQPMRRCCPHSGLVFPSQLIFLGLTLCIKNKGWVPLKFSRIFQLLKMIYLFITIYKLFGNLKNYVLINLNQLFLDKCPFLHQPTLCPDFFPSRLICFFHTFMDIRLFTGAWSVLQRAAYLQKSDSSSPRS